MPQCGLQKWSPTKNSLITLKTVINHKKNIKKQCKRCPSSHNYENRFLCEDLTARTWNCGIIWIDSEHSMSVCVHVCRNMQVCAHMSDDVPCRTSLMVQQLLVVNQNSTPPPQNSILQTSFCMTMAISHTQDWAQRSYFCLQKKFLYLKWHPEVLPATALSME